MHNVEAITIQSVTPLREAMRTLDSTGQKIVIITDSSNRVIGTCTDGDIRRALLRDLTLDAEIASAMNVNPTIAQETSTNADILALMRRENIMQIPVVDADGVLLRLVSMTEPASEADSDIPIVLMAGGLGQRLRPLTDSCPKPMLPIAGRPLLERIIERFGVLGFNKFFISINYLGHQIEEHFGTGVRHDVNVSYLREVKKLGTAGALSLLPANIKGPIIVMNGDLITEFDFRQLVESHRNSGALATMCTREHRTSIPFGVVEHEGDQYQSTVEKPTLVHQINAGVYCISAEALEYVPAEEFYDMPQLFADLMKAEKPCAVHKISDLWYDIGTVQEYERAQRLFKD